MCPNRLAAGYWMRAFLTITPARTMRRRACGCMSANLAALRRLRRTQSASAIYPTMAAGWAHLPPTGKYAVDPVLGRIGLPPALPADTQVEVDFHYGFSAEMGGGEYERAASFADAATPPQTLLVPDNYPTLRLRLRRWAGQAWSRSRTADATRKRFRLRLRRMPRSSCAQRIRSGRHWCLAVRSRSRAAPDRRCG